MFFRKFQSRDFEAQKNCEKFGRVHLHMILLTEKHTLNSSLFPLPSYSSFFRFLIEMKKKKKKRGKSKEKKKSTFESPLKFPTWPFLAEKRGTAQKKSWN